MSDQPKLVYVADPMCSWCWGFMPVMHSIVRRFGDRVPATLRLGGLRTNVAEPMDDAFKATAREHWEHVQAITGQPFNFAFFDRDEFIYDTEQPCRAVVAARAEQPDQAVPFLDHLHAAFYRDNHDITDPNVLCDLAEIFGFDRAGFAARLSSDAVKEATHRDFALTRGLGLRGFPSLVGQRGERLSLIFTGYHPEEVASSLIDQWLKHTDAQGRNASAATI